MDETDIAAYTPFEVSDSGPFTTAIFNKYKALTQNQLDRDDPGLPAEEYDHAHVMLIAHTWVARDGKLDLTQEKIKDYWYNKNEGQTSFIIQYQQLIDRYTRSAAAQPTEGIVHTDATMIPPMDGADVAGLYDPEDMEGE